MARKKPAQQFCYDEDRSDWIKPSSSARKERDAARDHRKTFARARNEVIAVLTRIWDSHLMKPAGPLKSADQRMVVCIHSPAGKLWWPIDVDEIDPHFAHLEERPNDWDKSSRAVQAKRLALLRSTARLKPIPVIGAPAADDDAPLDAEAASRAPGLDPRTFTERRPGEFHKPRTKLDVIGRGGGKVTVEEKL